MDDPVSALLFLDRGKWKCDVESPLLGSSIPLPVGFVLYLSFRTPPYKGHGPESIPAGWSASAITVVSAWRSLVLCFKLARRFGRTI
jgi:hypothetical protein